MIKPRACIKASPNHAAVNSNTASKSLEHCLQKVQRMRLHILMTQLFLVLTCQPKPSIGRNAPPNSVEDQDKHRSESSQPHTPNPERSAQRKYQKHLNEGWHKSCMGSSFGRQCPGLMSDAPGLKCLWCTGCITGVNEANACQSRTLPKTHALNHHCFTYFLKGMRKRKPNTPPHTTFW